MPELKQVPATHKVMERWPVIADALINGTSLEEVAEQFGVTMGAIQDNMQNPAFKQYIGTAIDASMMPLFLQHADMIRTLWESDDPRDRREAMKEVGRMKGSKYSPTGTHIGNVNITMNQDRNDFRDLLEVATPDEQRLIARLLERAREKGRATRIVEAEYNIPPTPE